MIKRDEFSALGKVSPASLKVTATDSMGNVHSALTDSDGEFLLFAPQAGLYTVRINNVFGEKFRLRQEQFVVDFNGLKEFKVTFVFEEKKRKINFKGDINGFNFAKNKFSVNDSATSTDQFIDTAENALPYLDSLQKVNQNNVQSVEPSEKLNKEPVQQNSSSPDPLLEGLNSSQIDSLKQEYFNDPNVLQRRPIMKEMVFYKVQVGAYNPLSSAQIIETIKNSVAQVETSPTAQGLTRLTVGSFKDINEAQKVVQRLQAQDLPNKEFILVVGEYFGKYLTADEASALLSD